MKSARENYVTKTQEEFKTQGVDATISDLDGNLVVISDVLKLKPDRDKLMQTTFDVAYRKGLCSAGFKTVELGSSALFRYGDKYSLGCPETKEERASRIEAQKRDRQRFVDDLQKKFEGDPAGAIPIRVEQQGSELVLTGSGDEVPPAILRALLSTEIDNDTKVKLCSLGFHGARARSNSTSGGVFQSFNCSQHNAQ